MSTDLLEKERNPGQQDWDSKLQRPGSSEESSSNDRNITAASQAERDIPTANSASMKGPIATADLGGASKRDKSMLFTKKITPFMVLVAIFTLCLGGLLAINVPGIVLVQIKEAVMGDLFDSVSSAELRTTHIFRAKLKNHDALKGCANGFSFRCNYKAISSKQMTKLRTAGFETVPEKPRKGPAGYRIDSLSYRDKSGKLQTITSREFANRYNSDPEFKQRVNQAYNPRWKMIRDDLGQKVMKKFKVSLQRSLGGSKKAMAAEKKAFVEKGISRGSPEDLNRPRSPTVDENADEIKRQQALDSEAEAKRTLSSMRSKSSGFRGSVGSVTRGANMFTGFQATACTVIKTAEVTGTMARVLKYAQLMRLFVLMANVADSITYGEATPEAVSFMGDFVTDVDLQEKTLTEESFGSSGNLVQDLIAGHGKDNPPVLQDNPHYGKSPTDAAGLKASLYGDVRNLDMRESQFMIGGGFNGTLRGVTDALRDKSAGALDNETCAFYENPIVQTGGLLLSLAGMVGTGGAGAAAAAAKAGAQAAVFSFAMGYLNGIISDMLNGTISDDSMRGVDVGNALFSGGAAFFGSMASSRGVTPVSTNMEVRNMQALRHESQQRQEQLARYEAQSEPFNIYNQYSFLGSIVWSLDPTTVQSLSRTGLALRTPQIIFSSLGTLLSPKAQAATISDPARFNKCNDPAFVGGGVIKNDDQTFETSGGVNLQTADIMCNIRYSNDPMDLNVDPSRIADWMIDAGQVDYTTGEAITDREEMASIASIPEEERDLDASETDTAAPRDGAPVQNVPLPEGGADDDTLDRTKRGQLPTSDIQNITDLPIADVMRPDDETLAEMGIPLDTPSDKLVTFTPGYQVARLAASEQDIIDSNLKNGENPAYLPPPIGSDKDLTLTEAGYDPAKDVRTYAHWLRFCRYGDEDGRTMQIGDADGLEEPSFARTLLGGLPGSPDQYVSDGRECLKSNTCLEGQDPNGAGGEMDISLWDGEEAMRNRCRPPVYDIYSIYHIDKSINDGMEAEESSAATDSAGGNLADGDARDLARQLADHEHLSWQNGQTTPNLLREFADKGTAINVCGEEFQVDKLLLQVMLKQLERYTIIANNIGFSGDRSGCDAGMHPQGKAIDINHISVREGDGSGKKTGPTITFGSSEEVDVITQFAIEWMDHANTVDKKAGRSGQIACGGYNLLDKRKPTWEGADGNLHFSDACNHLHIDVGPR